MSIPLAAAGALSALLGVAHSVLGEKLLLEPLFKRGELPKLLGSAVFARRTLRFAWHLTTVLLVGIGGAVIALSSVPLDPQSERILRMFAVTFGVGSLVSLIGARGKHFSWWVFSLIAILLWIGSSN